MKKTFTLIVNGQPKEWEEKEISFVEVVKLAFGSYEGSPQIVYTVTYKRGQGNKPEGTMVKVDSVKVKDKMIFNATRTDRS